MVSVRTSDYHKKCHTLLIRAIYWRAILAQTSTSLAHLVQTSTSLARLVQTSASLVRLAQTSASLARLAQTNASLARLAQNNLNFYYPILFFILFYFLLRFLSIVLTDYCCCWSEFNLYAGNSAISI